MRSAFKRQLREVATLLRSTATELDTYAERDLDDEVVRPLAAESMDTLADAMRTLMLESTL